MGYSEKRGESMKRLIPVVNKLDKIIAYKNFEDLNNNDTWRIAALWLENKRGDVLIAQRKFDKRIQPGKWGPAAAGTVEKGESYESNIYKEAQEEIGLSGITFKKTSKIFTKSPLGWRFFQGFVAVTNWPITNFRIQESEVEQIAYVPKKLLLEDISRTPSKYVAEANKFIDLFDL